MACDLAIMLRSEGHKITILTTAIESKVDSARNLDVHRVQANQKPKTPYDYFKITSAMKRVCKTLPAHDIVITMTDPPLQAIMGAKIAKKMRAKHVHWAMDLYPDLLPVIGHNPHKFIMSYFTKKMRATIKNADNVVPISKCMARYFSYLSLSKRTMTTIENWADKYLREDTGEPDQALLDDQKFRILYAGTIGLAHEFDTVLKAAKYLQKISPNIEFIFTNRGGGKDNLAAKIKHHGITNIKMVPPQPSKNLSALMASGDLHLITMKPDAVGKLFPSKFYSAIAAGRPSMFVGPDTCDLHNKITKNNCGVSVRNGDAKTLINGILKYYNDGDVWFDHCKNASTLHDNHHPLDQWKSLIESL